MNQIRADQLSTPKEKLVDFVQRIPPDANLDEILYRLMLFRKVELSLRDI